jgi:uncharacterized SAM-binding protein YcdF (DUF218 family)
MKKRGSFLFFIFTASLIIYLFHGFVYGLRPPGAITPGADAIVVLTGGKGRAEAGLSLLQQGAAGFLIVSGVNEDADIESIFGGTAGPWELNIILEKRSRSTYENAVEVRRLVKEFDIGSIVLITSGYHMQRASYTFGRILPGDVKIEPYTVSTPNFDVERWWGSAGSLWLVLTEFVKYNWYVVRFNVEGLMP